MDEHALFVKETASDCGRYPYGDTSEPVCGPMCEVSKE